MLEHLKVVLPDRPVAMRVWRGPFRGARLMMNPRVSLRKVIGLYEHELNGWLEAALQRVSRVLDVGANDGYFTFGCAAALTRQGRHGEIIGFEPQTQHVLPMRAAVDRQPVGGIRIEIIQTLVGATNGGGVMSLDAVTTADRTHTLIKIDVEGAEEDVIAGASSWLTRSNLFVIEVHRREYLERLRRTFAAAGLELDLIEQRPLPVLGREVRDVDNWWLVSRLASPQT